MHEMSIISGILNIVEEQARAAGAQVINTIEVEIGELAGVEVEALEFCFTVARKNTRAHRAKLVIHHIAGLGRCSGCDKDMPVTYPVALCPECGALDLEILAGQIAL